MRVVAAVDAKNRFGELLDNAQRGPVTIEKHGRAVAVVVSAEDYRAFEQLKIDRLKADIGLGLSDVEAGRSVDGARAFADIRADLGAAAAAVPKDG